MFPSYFRRQDRNNEEKSRQDLFRQENGEQQRQIIYFDHQFIQERKHHSSFGIQEVEYRREGRH